MLKGKGKSELYEQNKSFRYIAEAPRMSLRDIRINLNMHGLSHEFTIVKENGNNNDDNNPIMRRPSWLTNSMTKETDPYK